VSPGLGSAAAGAAAIAWAIAKADYGAAEVPAGDMRRTAAPPPGSLVWVDGAARQRRVTPGKRHWSYWSTCASWSRRSGSPRHHRGRGPARRNLRRAPRWQRSRWGSTRRSGWRPRSTSSPRHALVMSHCWKRRYSPGGPRRHCRASPTARRPLGWLRWSLTDFGVTHAPGVPTAQRHP